MFDKAAKRASDLSAKIEDISFIFTYYVKIGERKSVEITAKDHDSAKRKFEYKFPTARILNILTH